MEWKDVLIIVPLVIFLGFFIPWLQKFRAWQFYSLLLLALCIGYLFNGHQPHNPSWHYYALFILLIGSLIYRAVKFYDSIK